MSKKVPEALEKKKDRYRIVMLMRLQIVMEVHRVWGKKKQC